MSIRIPPNDAFLAWLTDQADPPVKRIWARRRVRSEAMRAHADLCDRLASSAAQLPATKLRYLAGFPVLIHPNGVAFGVAAGTTWIAYRIPALGQRVVLRSQWGARGLDAAWVDVDPWISSLPAYEGTSRVRGWARAAYTHAGELWGHSEPAAPRRSAAGE
jgi:hypothetical protein